MGPTVGRGRNTAQETLIDLQGGFCTERKCEHEKHENTAIGSDLGGVGGCLPTTGRALNLALRTTVKIEAVRWSVRSTVGEFAEGSRVEAITPYSSAGRMLEV